jgi:hypothetical protein
MNESILTQLKMIVERAVRRVRASTTRKRKMREELLAHVTAVFQEETRLGDERAALARTAERFGDPAELTRQLQAAVPASDAPACFVESLVGFPMQGPVLRRALRYASLVGIFCACLLAAFILVDGQWSEWVTLARLPSILAPVWMASLIFFATFLEHGMRQALFGPGGRRWPRALVIGVLSWLLVPSLVLAWSIAVSGVFVASLLDTLPLFLTSLLAPIALVIVVAACISEIRYLEEWASLPIDSGKETSA